MKLTKKGKQSRSGLFDACIDRINDYDTVTKGKPKMEVYNALSELPDCVICEYAADYANYTDEGDACASCPFDNCRPPGTVDNLNNGAYFSARDHQKHLIKRTKIWCKEHYPEYTLVKVK